MKQPWVIDKDYVFHAIGNGLCDDVLLHVQCSHGDAMEYGKYFSENRPEEIDARFKIKDQLDEVLALGFARSLFQEWEADRQEEGDAKDGDEREELTVEDFYDAGWETVAELYYCYDWSPEFIKDCMEYYRKCIQHP